MTELLIGYARVSTEEQDLTAQRDGLARLGVEPSRIYVDHGLTGTNRDRPGLREALAACRAGDTLVVTKLDRLARSLPDARAIAEDLTRRKVRLSLGGSVYGPTDPVGRLLFNVLAMVAEFEADLIRSRTKEGIRVAKAKGHLRGKQPNFSPRQEAHLVELIRSGEYTTSEVGDLFGVARSTVYRALQRSTQRAALATAAKAAPMKMTRAQTDAQRPSATSPSAEPEAGYRPRHGVSEFPPVTRAPRSRSSRQPRPEPPYRKRDADHRRRQPAQAADEPGGLHRKWFGLRHGSGCRAGQVAPRSLRTLMDLPTWVAGRVRFGVVAGDSRRGAPLSVSRVVASCLGHCLARRARPRPRARSSRRTQCSSSGARGRACGERRGP
jgi:DNA invertase Pin-like site-specific DNA recombinase